MCEHQTDTACAWLVCHSQEGLCKLYPPYPASQEARALSFFGEASHARESNPGPKPTLKTLLHTLTKYTNSPVPLNPPHPHSPQPTHRLPHPHLSTPLCKTHPHTTEHLFNCTHLYTSSNILDLWMPPGRVVPLLASWKGRLAATLTYWVVGPLHSYTQEGWVDNNNNMVCVIFAWCSLCVSVCMLTVSNALLL